MSTRSTAHFYWGDSDKPTAIIYRHSDGYPEGAGVDIHKFLDQCGKLADPRFNDPSYLAARYVVFLADKFNYTYKPGDFSTQLQALRRGKYVRPKSKMDFISVGVMEQDPDDIEYRYTIRCNDEDRPEVKCFEVLNAREVPIPKH